MRIAYCIESFWNTGGMERILSVKANWLSQHGYDITILIARQSNKPMAFPLAPKINTVDLNVNFKSHSTIFSNPIIRDYYTKLSQHLIHHTYDIVITMGGMELYFLHKIKDKSLKLAEFHFTFSRFIRHSKGLLHKAIALIQTGRMAYHATKYERVITLTQKDKAKYKKCRCKQVVTIPNPLTIKSLDNSALLEAKQTIAVGRLNYQKGFDFLIDSWGMVNKLHPDWKLKIYGDGEEKPQLSKQIDELGLTEKIFLMGNSDNITRNFLSSSICISSSRYEGFSLVLCEASACGLPLVAFDCPSGPGDIVINGKNGFLIKKVGDTAAMADAICKLIEDNDLRKSMGQHAKESSDRYELNGIMNQWTQLFKQVTSCT